jgi:hypothetical protein
MGLLRNTYIVQHTTHCANRGPILRIGVPAIHPLVSMSRYATKATYKQIVQGETMNVDVRDPFTGLPVRTDTQERALVDGAINQQPLHLHDEVPEHEFDGDNNLMDLGAPLPLPVDILPDHDVDGMDDMDADARPSSPLSSSCAWVLQYLLTQPDRYLPRCDHSQDCCTNSTSPLGH